MRAILHKDLGTAHTKSNSGVQELQPIDDPMRFRFAKWAFDRLTEKKIIFADEAHFDLVRYVNMQDYRIWGIENLHAYIEKPMHRK